MYRKSLALLILPALVALAAMQTESASQAPAEAAVGWTIDPVHSSAHFRIQHMGAGMVYGRFNALSGSFTTGGDGAVEFTVDAASVDTGNDGRDKHLRSPDFFDVAQFPQMTFVAKSFRQVEGDRWEAKGTLTLHGVSKEITVPVTHTGTGQGREGKPLIGFEATFDLQRSDYGMSFMVGPAADAVRVTIAVEAGQDS